MSTQPRLPQEICDYIIDLLHDDAKTLKQCSLVSKSWVPRTRNHLFSHITFTSAYYPKWRKTFSDPANSPACHTRVLTVDGALGDGEEMRWIKSFSRVEQLVVECAWAEAFNTRLCLTQFNKFAPSLKSLHVNSTVFPYSQAFDLICSLPLLEGLTLRAEGVAHTWIPRLPVPAPSPALTGSLNLSLPKGMGTMIRLLLGLQGGLRFRKLQLSRCRARDLVLVGELVEGCSGTLECLDVACKISAAESGPINLSKATRLKEIVIRCRSLSSAWITMTLGTITSEHRDLQRISIYVSGTRNCWYDDTIIHCIQAENSALRWLDLDHLLVQLWELYSIRSKVVCARTKEGSRGVAEWAEFFVPELMKRGILDLDEEYNEPE